MPQTDLYSNVSDGHNKVYIKTPDTNLADTINTYELIWNKNEVIWKLNGVTMRNVTDKSKIPNIVMKAR